MKTYRETAVFTPKPASFMVYAVIGHGTANHHRATQKTSSYHAYNRV